MRILTEVTAALSLLDSDIDEELKNNISTEMSQILRAIHDWANTKDRESIDIIEEVKVPTSKLNFCRQNDDCTITVTETSWPNDADILWSLLNSAQEGEYSVSIKFKAIKR